MKAKAKKVILLFLKIFIFLFFLVYLCYGGQLPDPIKNYECRMKWNSLSDKLSDLSFDASYYDTKKRSTERWTFQAGDIFHKEDYRGRCPDDSAYEMLYLTASAKLKNGDRIDFQFIPNSKDFDVTYGKYHFWIENEELYELMLSRQPS